MRKTIWLGLGAGAVVAVSAAQKIQPLNVKLGEWEVTTTMARSGQMPIPPEALARLTPEQRARMEERMKAQGNDKNTTRTYKTCLTKEKLERDLFDDDKKNCTRTVITSTSSKIAMKVACSGEGMSGDGTLEFEALSPESVKGEAHIKVNSGERAMTVNSTYTSKWIGATCEAAH